MPKIKINIISIEMKLCMSHYNHKSIPDATFESGSSSSFGDMMSQNFLRKKGTSHQIRLFILENGFNLKKRDFMSIIILLDQTLTPPPSQF